MAPVQDNPFQGFSEPGAPELEIPGRDENGAGARISTPDRRLRVFISSTIGELASEREAAKTAVRTLRLAPVMFELGARPHPPRDLYRSYLASVGLDVHRVARIGASGHGGQIVVSSTEPQALAGSKVVRRLPGDDRRRGRRSRTCGCTGDRSSGGPPDGRDHFAGAASLNPIRR